MADNPDLLKCPLCHGHGEIHRSELIDRLTHHELKPKIDAYLDKIVHSEPPAEMATVAAPVPERRDFQKDVHIWNPQLPMWRRSSKE